MTYTSYIPSPPLDSYIYDLYYLDGRAPYPRLKVFPMPTFHLMVNLGPAFRVHKPDQAQPFTACSQSWLTGMWSTYHIVDWPPSTQLFGIHFKPGGGYPFLHLPLSQLHNQVVELSAFWGHHASQMREQLSDAPTIQAGFAFLEQLLLAQIKEAPQSLPLVQHAMTQLARPNGALSIRALSDQLAISQSHLDTQFKRLVGVPPKTLAQIWRFVHVLRSIDPAQPVDWTSISHQTGFYDQSHFNKKFAAFTGHSPTDYLRLRRRFLAENPQLARSSLGQLPIE